MKKRRLHLFVIPLICVLLAGVLVVWMAASRSDDMPSSHACDFPYWLEEASARKITPNMPFFVADVDLDGNDDLLIDEASGFRWYRLHGKEMSLAGEATYGASLGARMVGDATGDGRPDFFVLAQSPEGPMLSCHDWFSAKGPSAPLYTIGPLFSPQWSEKEHWKKIRFFGIFAAKKGAHPTILLGLNPLKTARIPRSLLAYDGVTGKELWRYEFGPLSHELEYDGSDANAPLVVFTTFAVGTGISYGGTDDSHSYCICLDARNGRYLWKRQLTGMGGRGSLTLADINSDGTNEIVVARFLVKFDPIYKNNSYPWTVAVLSREGAILDSVPLGIRPVSICVANIDSVPSQEFLVQDLKGSIVFLNGDLATKRIIGVPPRENPARPLIIGVRDLTGDGKPEIVHRLDDRIIVRDPEGASIAERKWPGGFYAELARFDGMDHIIIALDNSIHVMALRSTTFATRLHAHSQRLMIGLLASAIVFGVGGFHLRRVFKRRREGPIAFEVIHNDLLRAMSAFGHGGSSLRVIDRIRLHLKNWDRVQADAAAREELFARLRATFAETIVPELEHIVMLAHRARVSEDIWGTILVRARLADKEIEAILAGSGEPVPGQEEHIAAALEALEDIDASLAKVRSYLRSAFRTPIAEALDRAVTRFRAAQGGREISLALSTDVPAAESVFISPVAFDKILEVLFSNSTRATEGRADAAIAIEVHWEGNYCKIDVRDNGCGIPREDWERAFERSYTTKVEGGFGLYYAREELARFNEKIFVLNSALGVGTTMRIVLRKS